MEKEDEMKRLIVLLLVLAVMAPFSAIADEKVIEVSRSPWGIYFELVINDDGKAYLRTHLQEFIDRNNGSVYAGKTVARISLMGELVRLTKAPD